MALFDEPMRFRSIQKRKNPLYRHILVEMKGLRKTELPDAPIFPGPRGGALSGMAMAMLLRRMDHSNITVHGFRSAFRDWAAETTTFPHEVCEMALAHVIANKAEAAYRRGDLIAKRRELMDAWADFSVSNNTLS